MLKGSVAAAVIAWAGGMFSMHAYYKYDLAKIAHISAKAEGASAVAIEYRDLEKIVYRDRVKTVTKEIPVIVERPVYKNVCLDVDGVEAFNTLMGN